MSPIRALQAVCALSILTGGAFAVQPHPFPASAETPMPKLLSVSAFGQVMAKPDMATVHLGVQADGPTAAAAMQANGERTNAMVGRIRALGIEEKDLQTTGLSLFPVYNHPGIMGEGAVTAEPGDQPSPPPVSVTPMPTPAPARPPGAPFVPVVVAYRAVTNLTVTVRDLSKAVWVIDAGVQSGANLVSGVNFGLSNPEAMREDSMRKAVQAAKANVLAQEAGVSIVGVQNLSEGGGYPGPFAQVGPFFGKGGDGSFPAVPVEPGQLTLTSSVSISYLIS